MLDKPGLKQDIITMLEELANETQETDAPSNSWDRFATKLSDAIDKFVKTGTVNTTGTAAAQTGTIS